jgi:hypothetical protein
MKTKPIKIADNPESCIGGKYLDWVDADWWDRYPIVKRDRYGDLRITAVVGASDDMDCHTPVQIAPCGTVCSAGNTDAWMETDDAIDEGIDPWEDHDE